MVGNTPEYLVEEVANNYGVVLDLSLAYNLLDMNPLATPDDLYYYAQSMETEKPLAENNVFKIPRGYNLFDPKEGGILPTSEGNYFIILREGSTLPLRKDLRNLPLVPTVSFKKKCYSLIYTGISVNLAQRDYKTHFMGKARRSTLRKSLGAIFGLELIKGKDGKITLALGDEQRLTNWMIDNLLLLYKENRNSESKETEYIEMYNPPLNLSKNHNAINSDFREELSALRNREGKGTSIIQDGVTSSKKKIHPVLKTAIIAVGSFILGYIFFLLSK